MFLTHAARWLTILLPLLMLAGPAPIDVGLSLVALLFLIRSAITRDASWLKARWVQCALLFWIALVARDVASGHPVEQFTSSIAVIRYILFAAAMAFWVLPDTKTSQRLWTVTLATVLFLIGDALWQYAFRADIFGRPSLPQGDGSVRLTGPFQMPRVGITILWFLFPLALPLLARRIWAGVALLVVASVAIYLSGERTALLLLLLGLALTFLLYPPCRKPAIAAVALLAVLLVPLSLRDPTLGARQIKSVQHVIVNLEQSTYGLTWRSALQIGEQHPLLGVGRKAFQPVCKTLPGSPDPAAVDLRCPMHAHNIYLELLVEYGALGLGLFMLLVASCLRAVPAGWRQSPLIVGLLIMFALRLWPLAVTPSQFVIWSAAPFWLGVGWLLRRTDTQA